MKDDVVVEERLRVLVMTLHMAGGRGRQTQNHLILLFDLNQELLFSDLFNRRDEIGHFLLGRDSHSTFQLFTASLKRRQ